MVSTTRPFIASSTSTPSPTFRTSVRVRVATQSCLARRRRSASRRTSSNAFATEEALRSAGSSYWSLPDIFTSRQRGLARLGLILIIHGTFIDDFPHYLRRLIVDGHVHYSHQGSRPLYRYRGTKPLFLSRLGSWCSCLHHHVPACRIGRSKL